MFKKLRAQLCLASVSNRKDIEMFWSSDQLPLEHLFGEQIIAILKIIDAELLISFSFGLKILRNDVIKEKIEILKVLNSFGNLSAIPNQLTFEAARTFILNYLGQTMIDEAKFYFNNAKEGEVKNKYNCHIEGVVNAILQSIYNPDGKIPYVGNYISNGLKIK